MQQIIKALQQAVNNNNFTAALMIALTVPDICGKLKGNAVSSKRYIEWYDSYMDNNYKNALTGNDCYALRCAILHEGSSDISEQDKRRILDKFYFTASSNAHMTRFSNCQLGDPNYDNKEFLQISVGKFTKDLISAVQKWLVDVEKDSEIQKNIAAMFCVNEAPAQMGIVKFK